MLSGVVVPVSDTKDALLSISFEEGVLHVFHDNRTEWYFFKVEWVETLAEQVPWRVHIPRGLWVLVQNPSHHKTTSISSSRTLFDTLLRARPIVLQPYGSRLACYSSSTQCRISLRSKNLFCNACLPHRSRRPLLEVSLWQTYPGIMSPSNDLLCCSHM